MSFQTLGLSAAQEHGIVTTRRTRLFRNVLEMEGRVVSPKTQRIQGEKAGSPHSELLLHLRLDSNPEALCLVRGTVERAAEVTHFPENQIRAIVRAVDEALANVIRHAYQGKKGMPIEVSCNRLWKDRNTKVLEGIEIVLSDCGVAADPAAFRGRPLDQIRPGGLGLHFIKQSMDVVEFSRKNGRNFLRLVKYLAPSKPKGPEGD